MDARESLFTAEDSFTTLVDTCPLALLVLDRGGRVIHANPAAAEQLGRSVPGLFGWHAAVDPSLVQRRIERPGGTLLWLRGRGSPAAAPSLPPGAPTEEFLAVLAHELRTPLTSMLGWVQLLRSGKLDAIAAAKALETLEHNTREQAQLIDDLLDASRMMSGKARLDTRRVDLRGIVEAALESARPMAHAHDIRLDTALSPAPLVVEGDATRLQQIAGNLVSNAIKFTPAGGRVRVKLAAATGDATLVVQDTGCGISPHFLPQVFEPFRQADSSITRAQPGLGLGLAIVRRLVELHGGRVRAESEGEGRGATFTVWLPLAAGVETSAGTTGRPMPSLPSLAGARVLLVDDEPDTVEVMAAVLARCEAEVMTACTVAEALALADRRPPDVVVADIAMPGEDGYALIAKLRAQPTRGARVPAVALTGYARPEDRERALAAGFQAHLSKPVDAFSLASVVASLVGGAKA